MTPEQERIIAQALARAGAWQQEMQRAFQERQLRAALPQKLANNRKGRRAAQAAKR